MTNGRETDMAFCVFLDGELARVFATRELAESYLQRIDEDYNGSIDGYFLGLMIERK